MVFPSSLPFIHRIQWVLNLFVFYQVDNLTSLTTESSIASIGPCIDFLNNRLIVEKYHNQWIRIIRKSRPSNNPIYLALTCLTLLLGRNNLRKHNHVAAMVAIPSSKVVFCHAIPRVNVLFLSSCGPFPNVKLIC